MATIVPGQGFSLDEFHKYLSENLPEYARPVFLRLCDRIETTATFKSVTHELKRDGYDPSAVSDSLFFNDRQRQAFARLDAALYESIQSGVIRF
jgi:fatty-acyl-CoA synthase